jgi:hypothetical protein
METIDEIKSVNVNQDNLDEYGHLCLIKSDGSLLSIREQYESRTSDNMKGFHTVKNGVGFKKSTCEMCKEEFDFLLDVKYDGNMYRICCGCRDAKINDIKE